MIVVGRGFGNRVRLYRRDMRRIGSQNRLIQVALESSLGQEVKKSTFT